MNQPTKTSQELLESVRSQLKEVNQLENDTRLQMERIFLQKFKLLQMIAFIEGEFKGDG